MTQKSEHIVRFLINALGAIVVSFACNSALAETKKVRPHFTELVNCDGQFQLEALRDIAWSIWDPIGLNHHENWRHDAPDEYDNYMRCAVAQFQAGSSLEEVTNYLVRIERDYMGRGIRDTTQERAHRTAVAIEQHVQTQFD